MVQHTNPPPEPSLPVKIVEYVRRTKHAVSIQGRSLPKTGKLPFFVRHDDPLDFTGIFIRSGPSRQDPELAVVTISGTDLGFCTEDAHVWRGDREPCRCQRFACLRLGH